MTSQRQKLATGKLVLAAILATMAIACSPAQAAPSQHIALILPLKGKAAKAGQYIRDGFLASYFDALAKDPATPPIRIYDSSDAQARPLYDLALQEGAVAIVGPVEKDQTRQILQFGPRLPVPTLLLNQSEPTGVVENSYQFSLNNEVEIPSLIARARATGATRAGLIFQSDDSSERIANLMETAWQASGGKIADRIAVSPRGSIISNVQSFMMTPASGKKKKSLQTLRSDIDILFIALNSNAAKQIRPTLKHIGANSIPVYALSSAIDASGGDVPLQDLNGTHYTEQPWLLSKGPTRQLIDTLLPASNSSYDRLYAFGMDAWLIINSWRQGQTVFPLEANTGHLTSENGNIVRQGIPVSIVNGVVTTEDAHNDQ